MRVGIIGAGPSGAYLAYLLARQGKEVFLFDKFVSREKPCGGGMTFKALDSFGLVMDAALPRTYIKSLRVLSANGKEFDLGLDDPLSIFSRRELDSFIVRSAVTAGATFHPEKVLDIERSQPGWTLRTFQSECRVDFLVGADGAKSLVRARLAGGFAKEDLALTMGYYVQGRYHQDLIVCKFLPGGFSGYLWSFPRHDHLSVGIITDLTRAHSSELRAHLADFVRELYPKADIGEHCFYSAVAPELPAGRWATNTYSGNDWALVGDAAGFVDPLTGEGIYYALRSAELLADALAQGRLSLYRSACHKEFVEDFMQAARWKRHVPHCFSLISRAIVGSRRSQILQKLANDFVAGRLTYRAFPRALAKHAPRILVEIVKGAS
jgi:geranylgeranyl reductase family protein